VEYPASSRVVTPPFVAVVVATFAVFATFGFLIFALPLYVRDALAGSDLAVGLAMGVGSIGAILAGPPSGRIADRRGRRIVLFASLVAMLAGYLVLALEPPLAVVVPIRVVAGAGEAAFLVAAFTMAVDLAPSDRRGEAMSLVTVGAYTGLAGGPVIAGVLLDGDRFALVFLAAAALVAVTGLVGLALPETRSEADGEAPHGWLPPRPALLPGLVLLLALLGFGGFNAFVVLHAREIGLAHPGLVFAVFGGIVVLVRVFGRRLPDRLGPRLAASTACAGIAAGLVVVAAWPTPLGLYLGTVVFAGGQALGYPALVLLGMARSAPGERSAVVGALAAFVDIALAAGAFVLGIAAEAAGYRAVFAAGALSAALGLALLVRVRVAAPPVAPPPVPIEKL
jgi:MFS family permease